MLLLPGVKIQLQVYFQAIGQWKLIQLFQLGSLAGAYSAA